MNDREWQEEEVVFWTAVAVTVLFIAGTMIVMW